jgi:two-component system, sensor histidine kinase and response regulator
MQSSSGASVLVVDDTIENLRLLAGMLGEHGYEVRPVTSGRQALQAAAGDPPDLILLDVNMPDMNGYEVCERLKASPDLRDIPVVFLTALTDTADKLKAFEVGGADYVTKPFQVEEVLARVQAHVALHRSRTELAESYDRLRALERLRDDLVHMVVHDMRSPLTVLLNTLDFLRDDVEPLGGRVLRDLAAATEAANTLTGMANDLLDVSRLEAGSMPLARAVTDIVEVASRVQAGLTRLDSTRVIEVEAAGRFAVDCDAALVQRVLENLVVNAVKHAPAGGRIRIVVTVAPGRLRVAVHDEGPGVPPEERSRIFEKFATVGPRKAGARHSAGLGLAFCKLAIEAHGGSIGVDDGAPQGSVFWFELPAQVASCQ